MKELFLDDNEERIYNRLFEKSDIVVAQTAQECIDKLQEEPYWDVVRLDHDLQHERLYSKNSGSTVAEWIAKHKPDIRLIIVHSWNPIGGRYMLDTLRAAGYEAHYIPFSDGKEVEWLK